MVKESPKSAAKSPPPPPMHVWAAQCEKCFKWRKIPTQEEFEEMRSKFKEEPFSCSLKPGVRCGDPADLDYDPGRRTWLAHKPNVPKTPVGFKSRLVPRKSTPKGNKIDIYFDPPAGKHLRSSGEAAAFLAANYDQFKDLTPADFSFVRPKILDDSSFSA